MTEKSLYSMSPWSNAQLTNYLEMRQKQLLETSKSISKSIEHILPHRVDFATMFQSSIEICAHRQLKTTVVANSAALVSRINILSQAIRYTERGVSCDYLEQYCNIETLKADLEIESSPQFGCKHNYEASIINFSDEVSCRAISAASLVHRSMYANRLAECLPGFPNSKDFPNYTTSLHNIVSAHLSSALQLLDKQIPDCVELYSLLVPRIFVTVSNSVKTSLGTHCHFPGMILAGFSKLRLSQDGIAATAAQLVHEACHLQLCLVTEIEGWNFPADEVYISPFKNEPRNLFGILHTVYPIASEIYIRVTLLDKEPSKTRPQTIAYIAALRYRLGFLVSHLHFLSNVLPNDKLNDIILLVDLAISSVDHLVRSAHPTLRAACFREQDSVRERHIWDIGQFLCRGVRIRDHRLDSNRFSKYTVYQRASKDMPLRVLSN